MILDIIILVILIMTMAEGLFKGFIYIFLHALRWIGAIVVAFFLTQPVARIMGDGIVGIMISETLCEKFYNSADAIGTASAGLPDIVRGGLMVTAQGTADIFTELLTAMIISILSFLLIIFAVNLLLGIFIKPASKRSQRSLLTGMDKLLGLVAGSIEGILLVFIFLALLVPVVNFASGSISMEILNQLNDSIVAGTLYNNNFLLLVTGGFFA